MCQFFSLTAFCIFLSLIHPTIAPSPHSSRSPIFQTRPDLPLSRCASGHKGRIGTPELRSGGPGGGFRKGRGFSGQGGSRLGAVCLWIQSLESLDVWSPSRCRVIKILHWLFFISFDKWCKLLTSKGSDISRHSPSAGSPFPGTSCFPPTGDHTAGGAGAGSHKVQEPWQDGSTQLQGGVQGQSLREDWPCPFLTFRGETWSGQVFVKTVMFGLQRHPPSPGRYEKETGRSHHQGKNAFLTLSLSIQEMGTVGSALLVTLKCHGISTAGYTRDQHTDRRL